VFQRFGSLRLKRPVSSIDCCHNVEEEAPEKIGISDMSIHIWCITCTFKVTEHLCDHSKFTVSLTFWRKLLINSMVWLLSI